MRVFVLNTCTTCRTALRTLRAAGHTPQVIDIRTDGLTPPDIAAMVEAFGDRAVNRASTTWRALSEAERSRPVVELLAAHPLLLKRPVIETDGTWTQGWSAPVQAALL